MAFPTLIFVSLGTLILRCGFIALHLANPERLWSDYERSGIRFHLARWLDWLTTIVILGAAIWAVGQAEGTFLSRSFVVFVAYLCTTLAIQLPVHRFPRTNLVGAWAEAKLTLLSHIIGSVAGALVAAGLAAIYFWWQG